MPPQYSTMQSAYKRRRLFARAQACGSVSQACREFGLSRKTYYKWLRRYQFAGRQLAALQDRSRRPHRHPRQARARDQALICRLYRRRRWKGHLTRFWHYLTTRRGVRLSVHGVWKVLRRAGLLEPRRRRQSKPKPYAPMSRPGERLQIDTKFLDYFDPHGHRIYQYTAIDEFSRWRFLWLSRELTPLASIAFFAALQAAFPFPIECVQTDHGCEFTYAALPHVTQPCPFTQHLAELGIRHKLIKIATPRHNGKVERSHRIDDEEFYALIELKTYPTAQRRIAAWNQRYNQRPHGSLGWKTPFQALKEYAAANNLSLTPKCYR